MPVYILIFSFQNINSTWTDDQIAKIGHSLSPKTRVLQLIGGNPLQVNYGVIFPREGQKLEQYIHDQLKGYQKAKEWFMVGEELKKLLSPIAHIAREEGQAIVEAIYNYQGNLTLDTITPIKTLWVIGRRRKKTTIVQGHGKKSFKTIYTTEREHIEEVTERQPELIQRGEELEAIKQTQQKTEAAKPDTKNPPRRMEHLKQ